MLEMLEMRSRCGFPACRVVRLPRRVPTLVTLHAVDKPFSELDHAQVRRQFARAAPTYAAAAVLAREVERRMLERLDYVKLEPGCIVDAGCGTGAGLRELAHRYPAARLVGIDAAEPMLRAPSPEMVALPNVGAAVRGGCAAVSGCRAAVCGGCAGSGGSGAGAPVGRANTAGVSGGLAVIRL